MDVQSRVRAFAEALRDEGVPVLISYMDDEGWHLAAPAGHWDAFADGLRTLAEECERLAAEDRPHTLN